MPRPLLHRRPTRCLSFPLTFCHPLLLFASHCERLRHFLCLMENKLCLSNDKQASCPSLICDRNVIHFSVKQGEVEAEFLFICSLHPICPSFTFNTLPSPVLHFVSSSLIAGKSYVSSLSSLIFFSPALLPAGHRQQQ